MRNFFEPATAAPPWLRQVLASIRAALTDIWPAPLRLKDYATADLPDAADFAQGLVWDSTLLTFRASDGASWLRFALYGSGVTSFNTRTGAVTLSSGDVTTALGFTPYNATNPAGYISGITSSMITTALGYTPTSVTGLTGVQSVAAFKTGLSLVKADVGLGSVDNTSDAAKNVLSATRLTTARNINGVAFDGTANVTINLSASRTIAMTGDVAWSVSFDGSGNVSAAGTIQAGTVSLAKMANMATASLFYRKTAGSGAPEVQTLTTLKADLGLTGTNSGDQTTSGTANEIAVSNGAANPVIALAASITGAWTAFTPTISASSGTFTTVSASGTYVKIGKIILYQMTVTITNAGTAAGVLQATLPTTAANVALSVGRENAATGYMVQGSISPASNILSIIRYDNITIIASGAVVRISGLYESQ